MTDGTTYGRSFILSIDSEASPVTAWSQVLEQKTLRAGACHMTEEILHPWVVRKQSEARTCLQLRNFLHQPTPLNSSTASPLRTKSEHKNMRASLDNAQGMSL